MKAKESELYSPSGRFSYLTDSTDISCQTLTSSSYSIQEEQSPSDSDYVLIWHEISISIPTKSSFFSFTKPPPPKSILDKVSGYVESGQFLAILGASGGGKTSLLNVLAGRSRSGICISGSVTINNYPQNKIDPNLIAYVQQFYIFTGLLTVKEHLTFQAHLRMNPEVTSEEKVNRIEELLQELSLKKCENSKIGIQGRGISGGEKKRLAFASELLMDPPIFICDEPTSGMDSFMAENIVNILKALARKNKIILCSIHQPSSEVFSLFDRLLILSNEKTVYFGAANQAVDFYTRHGFVCLELYNPADYFINVLAKRPLKKVEGASSSTMIFNEFENTPEGRHVAEYVESRTTVSKGPLESMKCTFRISWFSQIKWLLWRSFLCTFRNPVLCYVRLFQKAVLGILFGLIYFQLKPTQELVMNMQGALYAFITELVWPTVAGIINIFFPEIPLFLREYHNGMYKAHSYYIAKVIAWIPLFLLEAIVFTFIAYWMIGFSPSASRFFNTLFFMLLASLASAAYGALMATSVPSVEVAIAISFPAISTLNMLAGFYLNIKSIPSYISWLQYLDWMRYTNEAVNVIQWESVSNLSCHHDLQSKCFNNGQEVLSGLNMYAENIKWDVTGLILITVFYHFFAYLFLLKKTLKR